MPSKGKRTASRQAQLSQRRRRRGGRRARQEAQESDAQTQTMQRPAATAQRAANAVRRQPQAPARRDDRRRPKPAAQRSRLAQGQDKVQNRPRRRHREGTAAHVRLPRLRAEAHRRPGRHNGRGPGRTDLHPELSVRASRPVIPAKSGSRPRLAARQSVGRGRSNESLPPRRGKFRDGAMNPFPLDGGRLGWGCDLSFYRTVYIDLCESLCGGQRGRGEDTHFHRAPPRPASQAGRISHARQVGRRPLRRQGRAPAKPRLFLLRRPPRPASPR